jgi:hypothetical protein
MLRPNPPTWAALAGAGPAINEHATNADDAIVRKKCLLVMVTSTVGQFGATPVRS